MLALLLSVGAQLHAAPQQSSYPNTSNLGDVPDMGVAWFQQCLRVEQRQPRARDVGSSLPGKTCNASKLYYDKLHYASTSQAEWDLVRHCAQASNDTTVLMMLYANGFGVTQDADLAIKYACSVDAAGAEMAARVAHLANLQAGKRFDQCDDITSGRMGSICAWISKEQADKVRLAFLGRLRAVLTVAQQPSFEALVKTSDAFARARGNDEADMSGSAGVQLAIDAEAREHEWLRENLAAFEKGQFKLPAAEELQLADAELNQAYAHVMQSPETDPDHPGRLHYSTVEKTGVRTTQRAWLAYRDAWMRFAAQRYPALDPASLNAALTQWRSKQLARMVP